MRQHHRSADAQGHISFGPAICVQYDGSMDRVVISGRTPYYQHFAVGSGWGSWKSLGGLSTAEAGVTSIVKGRVDVFVRGTDGNLWWQYTTNNGASWSGWKKPGGVSSQVLAGTAPAACEYNQGMLCLLWVDANTKALMYRGYYTGSGLWKSPQNLGGICTSTPAATYTNNGGLEILVFVRNSYNDISYKSLSSWTTWRRVTLDATKSEKLLTGTGPGVSTCGTSIDLFWVGTDSKLKTKNGVTGSFKPTAVLGGICTSSPGSVNAGWVATFVRNREGDISRCMSGVNWGTSTFFGSGRIAGPP